MPMRPDLDEEDPVQRRAVIEALPARIAVSALDYGQQRLQLGQQAVVYLKARWHLRHLRESTTCVGGVHRSGSGSFFLKLVLRADTHLQQIVAGTGARAGRIFDAVALLASKGRTPQAAMLCRSLFEDMAVAHWLVLHENDPEFLIQRFRSQKDAIRLYNETQRVRYGQDPVEDISDLAGRKQELLNTFGSHARKDWWGVRRDGGEIGLPDVVRELAQADRFKPRFANERPILEEMFHSAQKWNNQQLHHTALGLYLRLGCSGQPPVAEPQPHPAVVLSQGTGSTVRWPIWCSM
jgi:hypothetical protein